MSFFYQPWPYLATALLVAWMSLYAHNQPRRPGRNYFSWILVVGTIWALAAAVTTLVLADVQLRYFLWIIKSTCGLLTSPLAVMFALQYTGNEKWLTRPVFFVLTLPAIVFALATTILPSSMFVSFEIQPEMVVIHSAPELLWISYAINIVTWLIGFAVLVDTWFRAPAFKAPILWILVGQLFPRIAYAVLESQDIPLSVNQATILLSNFTIFSYFVALYYFQILLINPVAQNIVVKNLPYGILVLDRDNRLVDFNQQAQKLPGLPDNLKVRQSAEQVLGGWWEFLQGMLGPEAVTRKVNFHTPDGRIYYEVQSIPLLQLSGWRIGQVFIIEDITQSRLAQQQQEQERLAHITSQEREQLANELHDGLSQSLAFLGLQAQTAQLYLNTGKKKAAEESLYRLIQASQKINDDTRDLIHLLMANRQPVENFCGGIHKILADFELETGLFVELSFHGYGSSSVEDGSSFDPSLIPAPVAGQLLRIIQEALTNIRKHADGVSQVQVQVTAKDRQVILAIKDNGKGFDPSSLIGEERHFGLQVMRSRTEQIGGQISIFSTLGEGTSIEVCAPLPAD